MGNLYIVQYLQEEKEGEQEARKRKDPKSGTCCCCTSSPVVNVVGEVCTTDVVGVYGLDVCVIRLSKLKARSPSIPDNVLDLLGDRVIVKGWQERKGLKEPANQHQKLNGQSEQGRKVAVRELAETGRKAK